MYSSEGGRLEIQGTRLKVEIKRLVELDSLQKLVNNLKDKYYTL